MSSSDATASGSAVKRPRACTSLALSESGGEGVSDGVVMLDDPSYPASDVREPWPPKPSSYSLTSLRGLVVPVHLPTGICPCCLQTTHSPQLFPALVSATCTLSVRWRVCSWDLFCIHCNLMYTLASLKKARVWLRQYCCLDRDVQSSMYVRAHLRYASVLHCTVVPDMEGWARERPLAYLLDTYIDHPSPDRCKIRMKHCRTPWHTDARSILITMCDEPGCQWCDDMLWRKVSGISKTREGSDSDYVFVESR